MSATMLSSHSMTPLVTQRLEKDALNNLTDRFAAYLSRVRQMREQSIHMDNINFVNTTKILEDEILSLKTMYERQLEELRNQLEDTGRERSSYQMMSAKNAAQLTDVSQRLAEERNLRKKTENELADAYRSLAEKEVQLQEARVVTTQQMNSHEDTKRDRHNVANNLMQTQHDLENESAVRANFEATAQNLRDKLKFDAEVHQKEIQDYRYRLAELERALLLADERLHEHNIVDENLSAMLAQLKLHSDEQLRRYKHESEYSYQSHMTQMQTQLDNESRNLTEVVEENIKLKAALEQMNTKYIGLESKCQTLDGQNRGLIQDLEMERQQSSNTIKNLEAKLREVQQALMAKIRELGLAYSMHTPIDLELGSLTALLEAEEKRLALSLSSNVPLTSYRSTILPSSLTAPKPAVTSTLTRNATSLPNVHAAKQTKVKQKLRPKTSPGNFSSATAPLARPITTSLPLSSSMSYIPNYVDYYSPTSSHTGHVKILEVNPSGKYVRLFNSSTFQDDEIGGYMIQQNISGSPVTVFRFPPRTKLKANSHVTVWSAASLAQHNPPSDFLWKDQHKWGTGPECTTIICKPNGQAVAWTTAAFPFGVPKPVSSRSEEGESPQYDDLNKSVSRSGNIGSLPYSLPTDHSLHPNAVQSRVTLAGNDGMTSNAQSRSQSRCPEEKDKPKRESNRSPMSKAGTSKNGGTIRVVPSTNFSSPSQRFSHGLAALNSQQRVSFKGPMPRPYTVRKM
ncbi:lamin-L(I)-like isoform X1 [Paramuricea clavata]|uniref:Lamin-L(I)-like isoform X1 n=1 Tax=Paramuricea clavata TaxID=317549 RepID=A0A7D9D661_PARCT|nr:lamin-L(I)-like isoform X1 [Paramuricea clavata]